MYLNFLNTAKVINTRLCVIHWPLSTQRDFFDIPSDSFHQRAFSRHAAFSLLWPLTPHIGGESRPQVNFYQKAWIDLKLRAKWDGYHVTTGSSFIKVRMIHAWRSVSNWKSCLEGIKAVKLWLTVLGVYQKKKGFILNVKTVMIML